MKKSCLCRAGKAQEYLHKKGVTVLSLSRVLPCVYFSVVWHEDTRVTAYLSDLSLSL